MGYILFRTFTFSSKQIQATPIPRVSVPSVAGEHPFPAEITQLLSDFMEHAGPEMSFVQKMAFANP
ncbi:MAG: hypothetical protein AAF934_06090 [Bacteroidota bacterium]